MQPNEAIAYLTQVCNDYSRTLPPSAAMPFSQVAQDALNTLAPLANPAPDPGERPALHAVPQE